MEQILKAIEQIGLPINTTLKVEDAEIFVADWKDYHLCVVHTDANGTSLVSMSINLEHRDLELNKLRHLLTWQYYQETEVSVALDPTGAILIKVSFRCPTKMLETRIKYKIEDIINAAIEVIKIIRNPITNSQCLN